ncbi:hypothetical protein V492_01102 [Pseudogymnoascus sp. VKM F-4246]|nr:hypothetical protein V492_01102 [Pseudogymnoascus sp. VKM F-4246]
MAPTRPAQNGPTPKTAPTTQNNGIKKTSKPSEQQLYVVSRETNDPEGVHDNHEIVGTYKTLATANAAARDDLIKGWGREYFDAYESSEVDGMVRVVAACPDGEEMVVLVEKAGVRKTPAPKAVKQSTYTVTREMVDPYQCHDCHEILGTYDTLAAANEVARNNMIEEWGTDYFTEFVVEEMDGMVHVAAMCPDGESMVANVEKTEVARSSVAGNSAVESLAVGAPGEITVYHVTRHTVDYHHDPDGGLQDTMIMGTYLSLEMANEAARRDLVDEWGDDHFPEYEETVINGMVSISAGFPEGEEDINVYVEKGKLFTRGMQLQGPGEVEEELEESASESADESDEYDRTLRGAFVG